MGWSRAFMREIAERNRRYDEETKMIIEPTVGRVVWFRPPKGDPSYLGGHNTQPLAALIAHVHSDRLINLAVFDENGQARSATSVPLLQGDDAKPEDGFFASWMPYQKGQAAKTEQLERKATT